MQLTHPQHSMWCVFTCTGSMQGEVGEGGAVCPPGVSTAKRREVWRDEGGDWGTAKTGRPTSDRAMATGSGVHAHERRVQKYESHHKIGLGVSYWQIPLELM